MRLVWDARFVHLPAALLHVTLTVPAPVRPLVTDVKASRRVARETVEAWARRHYGVERDEKLFILDVFHPAGDSDPAAWAPHANIFIVARVLTPDASLRPIRAYATKAALADLSACWTAALAGLVGQGVERAATHLAVHTRPDARKFALRRELRSFPGWMARGLGSIVWAGAFGNRVWHRIREQLAIPKRERCQLCKAPHPHRPGEACGAPLIDFASLPEESRAAVRAAEDRTGERIVEAWERTFDDHSRSRPNCDCDDCKRGRRSPAFSAVRATRRAAMYAKELATAEGNEKWFELGGEHVEAARACRAAYEAVAALPSRGVTVEEARAPRAALLDFIRVAERLMGIERPGSGWGKRLDALLDERARHDEEATKRTGRWQLTVNFAWDQLLSVTGPYSTLRVDREEVRHAATR